MDAASVAITLCTTCIHGYRAFQSLKSLGNDAQIILSKIEIQEHRLQGLKQTLEIIQRSANIRDLNLVKDSICNTLKSIQLLTTDATHLRSHYKLKLETDTRNTTEEANAGDVDTPSLGVRVRRAYVWKWLVFDKANMDKLATDLKTLTDGLEDLFQMAVRHEFPSSILAAWISSLNTQEPSELKIVAAASADTYPDLSSDATRKLERLAAESDFHVDLPRRATLYGIGDFSYPEPAVGDNNRAMAMLPASRELALLEWRGLSDDFEERELSLKRLEMIASLLGIPRPTNMRILGCLGYLMDRDSNRAALVYRHPPNAARERPRSLMNLLEMTTDLSLPSLDDRYVLALRLAETVFHLHMSGWLHKSINSHNVLFFQPNSWDASSGPFSSTNLMEPYLTGFEFSRKGGGNGVTTTETVVEKAALNRYRHPSCQGPYRAGFKKAHDLYRYESSVPSLIKCLRVDGLLTTALLTQPRNSAPGDCPVEGI